MMKKHYTENKTCYNKRRRKLMKKILSFILLLIGANILIASNLFILKSKEDVYEVYSDGAKQEEDFATYEEAYQYYMSIESNEGVQEIRRNEKTVYIEDGMVIFPYGSNSTIKYTDAFTGRGHYTTGNYARDAGFISYDPDNHTIRFSYAGSEGIINADLVRVESFHNQKDWDDMNMYYVKDGVLYHHYTYYFSETGIGPGLTVIGEKQEYLLEDVTYYGYDGHYFYEKFSDLSKDLKEGTHQRAVNAENPYYNYFQFLSHRSYTSYSAEQIDEYLSERIENPKSKLLNMGQAFIDNQNYYGVNALLMLGVAVNESAWGTSRFALERNNLFGHAAYDSDPDGNASSYSTPEFSIYVHAYKYVSDGYLDPKDYSGRYFGGNLGNKASGMNVKYASDPYWGEKAAQLSWSLYFRYPEIKDAYRYTIGILDTYDSVNIRKEPSTDSALLYQTGKVVDYPLIILDTVQGSEVNGNTIWYKIQTDPKLKDDRNSIYQSPTPNEKYPEYTYDPDNCYAYVHSSLVKIIYQGDNFNGYFQPYLDTLDVKLTEHYISGLRLNTNLSEIQQILQGVNSNITVEFFDANGNPIDLAQGDSIVKTGMQMKVTLETGLSKEFTIVIKGDTDGDGLITDIDYVRVRKHLSTKEFPDYFLTGAQLQAANVKSDDGINDIDYVRIRKHLSTKEFPDYTIDGMK